MGTCWGRKVRAFSFLSRSLIWPTRTPLVIEIEFLGIIDGVAEFDFLADIGGGDLVEGALEADGGIVD